MAANERGPVLTKTRFLALAAAGRAGNQMPSWPTVEAALADGYSGPVMIRSLVRDSGHMRPNVPIADAPRVIDGLVADGADRASLYLTHMTAEVGRRINAELWWDAPGGPYLNYSTLQCHLREALDRGGRHAQGSAALAVLRWACDPSSFDDLLTLRDLYPDHMIELTAYDREIGSIPGRSVVIWEIRAY